MSAARVSVLFHRQPTDPRELVPFAELVREGAAERLWFGQSLQVEGHHAAAWLAGAGLHVPIGIGVALTALRHPVDAALQARSVARLMERAPVIGYGAAHPGFVTSVLGAPYARPAALVAEYAGIVRRLVRGEHVEHDGPHFRLRHGLPKLDAPVPEIGAGVLRPGMGRAAGGVVDTAISWLAPAGYLADVVRPALAEGARAAGRAEPPRVVAVVHTAVARPGRNPLLLAQAGAGAHLTAPHYCDMLRRAGLDVHHSDPASGARELVDEGVFVYGKPGDIAAALHRYHAAGVDEVVLNTLSVDICHGREDALTDLREICAAMS
ncbi:LLM class flavin-dependent oxidoreductase [Streptomyces sp. NBC_00726]|uniref:LLM class flavin-dependent oxidoreductase n=1 Tax=Streptomyces sp. NBC_00726 TaxID=2903674 RepID=UPI00386A1303